MGDFTASNGGHVATVRTAEDGDRLTVHVGQAYNDETRGGTSTAYLIDAQVHALREYFQHERDTELGRWRWPENPDHVVYPPEQVEGGDGGVWVLCESDPGSIRYASPGPEAWPSNEAYYARAARAYFDAHPEPKPWHDARFGEVWALTDEAGVTMPATFQAPGVWTSHGSMSSRVRDGMNITAARRIWPEAD